MNGSIELIMNIIIYNADHNHVQIDVRVKLDLYLVPTYLK